MLGLNLFSQNLVIDYSFEDYDSCPVNIDDFFLKYWSVPIFSSTPDYYNDCSVNFATRPATANFGSQLPRTGEGYVGAFFNSPDIQFWGPESFQGHLITPMQKDSFYCVKFYLSLTEVYHQPIAEIGIYFSDTPLSIQSGNFPYIPQLQSPGNQFFGDTENWMLWQQSYKAKGGEKYFTISNFNTYIGTPRMAAVNPLGGPEDSASYYYVDDVSIELLPTSIATTGLGADSLLCDTVGFSRLLSVQSIYDSVRWSTGASTSSIFINTIGEYSVRCYYAECAVLDTIRFSYFGATTPLAIADTAACEKNAPVFITAPMGFDSYRWSSGDTGRVAGIMRSGSYQLTAINYCGNVVDSFEVQLFATPIPPLVSDTSLCEGNLPFEAQATGQAIRWYSLVSDTAALATAPLVATAQAATIVYFASQTVNGCESEKVRFTASINPLPEVNIGDKLSACIGRVVELSTLANASYRYLWSTGDTLPYISVSSTGRYSCEVSNSCGTVRDNVDVEFVDCTECLYVPNAFSPNGDNKNDLYFTYTVCPIRYFELQIFNRWGELVFSSQDIAQGWDGNYKSQALPTGVYTYRVLLVNELGKSTTRKGSVTLIR